MKLQRGFTVVELIVALGIGLLITLASSQLFVANLGSFNLQRASLDAAANGRLAIDQLQRSLRRAGFNSYQSPYAAIPIFTTDVAQGTLRTAGGVTSGTGSGVGIATSTSDVLVLQYRTIGGNEVDCEGTAIAHAGEYGTLVTERYYLKSDTDGVPSLFCNGSGNDSTSATSDVALARNIENFQLLLGVDNVVDDKLSVTRYMHTSSYRALPAPLPPIVAVRVGVLTRSDQAVQGVQAISGDTYVLQERIAQGAIPDDRRLRRVYVTTVQLRNINQGI